jgi:2-methylcitrate dehydratase
VSVARELAQIARSRTYEHLPFDVIHQTKRVVLDTLGCALGGFDSEASRILVQMVQETEAKPESTVFGSGIKTSSTNAILANGAMVRYLDYNDTAFIIQGETYRTGYHPSEVIPGILAVAERQHLSGQDVIAAINLAYDLSLGFLQGVQGQGIEKKGWNGDTRGAYIMPIVFGSMMGLNEEQMANAVGIAGSCHAVLGILDTPAEEYTMTKNIRFPTMAQAALQAVLMASKGFTGPTSIIEGHDGLAQVVMAGEYNTESLLEAIGKYTIRDTCIKSIIADFSSHGHLTATLTLAKQHDIRPENVARINITTSKRCAEHTGDPVKKYPKNKETADHSSYYLTAVAIIHKEIGPDQFTPEIWNDPLVIDLIDKVSITGDPILDKFRPAGVSEITLKTGETYSLRVDYPRGHARNPMTDQEITAKARSMALKHMEAAQFEELAATVFSLEQLETIDNLLKLMTFPSGEVG